MMGVRREGRWGTLGAWVLNVDRSQDQRPVFPQGYPGKCPKAAS